MSLHYKILPYLDPKHIFALIKDEFGAIFLDSSALEQQRGRYSFILRAPVAKFVAKTNQINQDLLHWKKILAANTTCHNPNLPPFCGGLVGYLSYDLSKQLEVISTINHVNAYSKPVPDYWFGLYNQVLAFDNVAKLCYVMVSNVKDYDLNLATQVNSLLDLYYTAQNSKPLAMERLPKLEVCSNFSQAEYMQIVKQAINYIEQGDIFEVNLAQCFSAILPKRYPLYSLYQRLRKINPAPFAAFLNLGGLKILSASPERFMAIQDKQIEVRPIKGTIKRSLDPITDQQLADKLKQSIKDRAENIMIVDLMRNDLSKICISNSIKVSQLCQVESFTNVHHLVSVIKGKLKPELSIIDVIPACFPGGSITGAPKIRAMQIIEQLEKAWRGVYCGSIGYFGFNGNVDLSIAIRTIIAKENKLSFSVGGAITLHSNPQEEYLETLVKGQKLSEAINDCSN